METVDALRLVVGTVVAFVGLLVAKIVPPGIIIVVTGIELIELMESLVLTTIFRRDIWTESQNSPRTSRSLLVR